MVTFYGAGRLRKDTRVIQIIHISREAERCQVRLGCTCGKPTLALYRCEDDQILFCTHCGALTTRDRLFNESSTPNLPQEIAWLNVSDHAECPLINASVPVTLRARLERGRRSTVEIKGKITKISAEKCFLRLEGSEQNATLRSQQEIELVSDKPPLAGHMPGIIEDIMWPHGPKGPVYYKVRLVPLTLEQNTALDSFFQSASGLQFESRVLLLPPAAGFEELRHMILERMPKAWVKAAANAEDMPGMLKDFNPDLCLMPPEPGLLEGLGPRFGKERPAMILLLPDRSQEAIRDALLWGAKDILFPAADKEAVGRAIQRCLKSQATETPLEQPPQPAPQPLINRPAAAAEGGDTMTRAGTRGRSATHDEDAVRMLCVASETHDAHSSNHLNRMAAYTAAIARKLELPAPRISLLATASKLHDVGKMGVPDEILKKTGALTVEERKIMQDHTRFGHRILQASSSEVMRLGATIALRHHERYDGQGYPDGLAGDAIPIEARIVTVADVFDALTTQRSYKAAWSTEQATEHLQEQAGRMFAPEVIEAFLRARPEIEQTRLRFLDDFRDIWTERREDPRIPTPAVPLALEIAMPEMTFRPRALEGELINISSGGIKMLLSGISLDLFTLLVKTQRYAKISCTEPGWTLLNHNPCLVSWVDYYAVPDPTQCLIGLRFQKAPEGLETLLANLQLP